MAMLRNRADSFKGKVSEMEALASAGDPDALYWLGAQRLPQRGIERHLGAKRRLEVDEKLAVRHLRRAASKGHSPALLMLAKLHTHLYSAVLKYDPAKALELTVQAAEQGSGNARDVLARLRLDQGSLVDLLTRERGSTWGSFRGDLADQFIDEFRGRQAIKKRRRKEPSHAPDNDVALHPIKHKPYSLIRSGWIDGGLTPTSPGVYERLFKTKSGTRIFYSFWCGSIWSKRRGHPDDLIDGINDGGLEQSVRQRLPWRGLTNNPEAAYVTYVDPPGPLRPDFDFGGYVEHKEDGSPLVKMVHVAKALHSADGDYLTACTYRLRGNQRLRLWSDTEKIKVVDGSEPVLCPACRKIAFLAIDASAGSSVRE